MCVFLPSDSCPPRACARARARVLLAAGLPVCPTQPVPFAHHHAARGDAALPLLPSASCSSCSRPPGRPLSTANECLLSARVQTLPPPSNTQNAHDWCDCCRAACKRRVRGFWCVGRGAGRKLTRGQDDEQQRRRGGDCQPARQGPWKESLPVRVVDRQVMPKRRKIHQELLCACARPSRFRGPPWPSSAPQSGGLRF